MAKKIFLTWGFLFVFVGFLLPSASQDLLSLLGQHQKFKSKRISSYDRTGGNNDRLAIPPSDTVVLAEIDGPAAIHHIWVTIAAEPFYGRKIILRIHWDGEETPSVEAPIGDFFGVGHGLNRNLSSLPIANSSSGRARNCYWSMPFRKSARITATNEGGQPVGAFYYYIDYRELEHLPSDAPYFHAQYRQEMPCLPGKNYLILEASGRGHYVGCNMSILQRAMGWWGEGDDMIYVDGEEFPSLHGTGSEDYFSDAWGMREDENLFYGCPLQEPDFKTGAKATVYRFHIPDPIVFQKSIRVTIEHGHANNRSDFFSSVAYWYQSEPHKPFPALPPVEKRLPFALEPSEELILPEWEELETETGSAYTDQTAGMVFTAEKCTHSLTSFYNQEGRRYPILITEDAQPGAKAEVTFDAGFGEQHDVNLFFLKGPLMGNIEVAEIKTGEKKSLEIQEVFNGFSEERILNKMTLKNKRLSAGKNTIVLQVKDRPPESRGTDLAFVSLNARPSQRRFIKEWILIGPFDAPDMSYLQKAYPPEVKIELKKKHEGKNGKAVGWITLKSEKSGYMRLEDKIDPPERGIIYGLVYVHASEPLNTHLLVGSDDGVRIWLNDRLTHTNPAYRGCYPDQDKIPVQLQAGWNKLLIKVLQGGGGWGFYVRFVDPDGQLRFSLQESIKE
ncbi:MAG: DUF2961 domain-containing protein [Candidatus Aminicenantes bacterium]|jgi:hypothetical protein